LSTVWRGGFSTGIDRFSVSPTKIFRSAGSNPCGRRQHIRYQPNVAVSRHKMAVNRRAFALFLTYARRGRSYAGLYYDLRWPLPICSPAVAVFGRFWRFRACFANRCVADYCPVLVSQDSDAASPRSYIVLRAVPFRMSNTLRRSVRCVTRTGHFPTAMVSAIQLPHFPLYCWCIA
jgi:hypothetical protein